MIALLAVATSDVVSSNPIDFRMAGLYEEICLKAFPSDSSVKEIMAARHARQLSTEEVQVTMGGDPAVGWVLPDEHATVWLEFPPFHACSVRWNAHTIGILEGYREVVKKFKSEGAPFAPTEPMEADRGDIHIRLVGEQRVLPNEVTESLMVVDQHISNPSRRAAGETGVSVRFVHQFAAPDKSQ